MAVDGVALALVAMKDDAVRERVRSGELEALGDVGELTDEEQELVVEAAQDDPEVEGFDMARASGTPALNYVVTNQKSLSPKVRSQFDGLGYGGFRSAGGVDARMERIPMMM